MSKEVLTERRIGKGMSKEALTEQRIGKVMSKGKRIRKVE